MNVPATRRRFSASHGYSWCFARSLPGPYVPQLTRDSGPPNANSVGKPRGQGLDLGDQL